VPTGVTYVAEEHSFLVKGTLAHLALCIIFVLTLFIISFSFSHFLFSFFLFFEVSFFLKIGHFF